MRMIQYRMLHRFQFVRAPLPYLGTPRTLYVPVENMHIPGMYTYVCQIFVFLPTFLFAGALFGKHQVLGHEKPRRTHWSRSRGDPCTLKRVASAQTFFPDGSG